MEYTIHYAPYPLQATFCMHSIGCVGVRGPGVSDADAVEAEKALAESPFAKLGLWAASMVDGNPCILDRARIAEVTCAKCLGVIEVLK